MAPRAPINYRTEDFVEIVKAETNGKGVDVILDMVGGDYVMRNVNALARGGRLVNIAYQKGAKVEVDFRIVQNRLLSLSRPGSAAGRIARRARSATRSSARSGRYSIRPSFARSRTESTPWPRPRPRTI